MRKPIPHEPGAIYHATLRGNRGQAIFQTSADRLQFEQRLQEALARCQARLHAYCWMTNHVHLLVQVADQPLGQLVHHAAGCYARDYNRRHDQRGHLLQGRYRAKLVRTDSYLLAATRYIHMNPVAAGLVADAAAWRWSSHRVYLGRKPAHNLHTEMIMSHFDQSRTRYQRFMAANDASWKPQWQEDTLGTPHKPRQAPVAAPVPGLPELMREASTIFDVRRRDLPGPSRSTSLVLARAWVGYWATRNGLRLATAAHAVGRHPGSLSRTIRSHQHDLARLVPGPLRCKTPKDPSGG